MITLQNSQPVEGNPELRVLVDTGTYDETDLIECYHVDNPSIPFCMMQAQRIKFGDIVYHQDVPLTDEQVAAVEAGEAASEVVAHERFKDGFKKKRKRVGRVISKRGPHKGLSKDEIKQARQEILEEESTSTATSTDPVVNESPQPNPTSTPTTPDPTETSSTTSQTSTTTNPVIPEETGTTTPPVIDPPTPDETATSTEPVIPEETATTTEPVAETPIIDTNASTPPVVETASSTQTLISRIRSKKTTGKIASRIVSKLKKL